MRAMLPVMIGYLAWLGSLWVGVSGGREPGHCDLRRRRLGAGILLAAMAYSPGRRRAKPRPGPPPSGGALGGFRVRGLGLLSERGGCQPSRRRSHHGGGDRVDCGGPDQQGGDDERGEQKPCRGRHPAAVPTATASVGETSKKRHGEAGNGDPEEDRGEDRAAAERAEADGVADRLAHQQDDEDPDVELSRDEGPGRDAWPEKSTSCELAPSRRRSEPRGRPRTRRR